MYILLNREKLLNIKQEKKSDVFLGFIVIIGVILAMIFIEMEMEEFEDNQQKIVVKQSYAIMNISSISSTQIDFYQKKNKFASKLEELSSFSHINDSDDYHYSVFNSNNSQAIATATAKKDSLKSYTIALFLVKNIDGYDIKITGICGTNTPSKTPPGTPKISGKNTQCPSDSKQVKYPDS